MIGNKFRNSFGAHRALGDLPARAVRSYSGFCNTRSPANSTTVQAGTSFPVGLPNGWYPPIEGGEMVMRSTGSSSMTANLYPSKSMAIDLTGFGDLQATAGLVISMLCAMTGSGTLTAAIEGRLNMSADFTGSGDLEASMSGIGNMLCDMTGTGDLEAVIAAYGNMAIDIVVTGTGLTTANVGQAVLSTLVESGYTAADILRILGSVSAGLTTITDLGGGDATVAFTGLDGSTVRVEADMEGSERVNITIDAS